MKTLLSFTILIFSIFHLNARSVAVSDFDQVRIWGNLKVVLMESDENQVNVEYDLHKVDISVENGVLKLKRDKVLSPDSYDSQPIEVVIEYQRLNGLKVSAGARVKTARAIMGDHLKIEFVSGAQGKIEIEVNDLDLKTASGAELKLYGKAYSQRTYVKSNTGGEAKVVATETLEANATTGGMIYYEGGAEMISIKDNLGGEVRGY